MQSRAQEFTGLAYDSRSLARGDIFFCIQGEKFDGNDYVRQAAEQGAALIISEKQKPNAFFHPYVQVPDIRLAMADAASIVRVIDSFNHSAPTAAAISGCGSSANRTA